MINLLSRERLRHLKLIEWLYLASEPLSLTALSSELNCSHRTLSRDIKYINLMYAPLQIKSVSTGKELTFPQHISLDFAISRTLTLSLPHSFLELIFFKPDLIAEELATQLFISLSSLKRLIHDLQQKIAPFDIQLKSRPYRLTGDEKHIQQLYLYLLKNKYPNYYKLFTAEQLALANQLLTYLRPYFKAENRLDCLNNFFYLLLATAIRPPQDCSLTLNPHLNKYLIILAKEQPDYATTFEQQFELPFNQSFTNRLVNNLFFCEEVTFELHSSESHAHSQLLKNQLRSLLRALEEQFHLKFHEHPLLYHDLLHLILLKQPTASHYLLLGRSSLVPLTITDEHFYYFSFYLSQTLQQSAFKELTLYHDELQKTFEIYWSHLNLQIIEKQRCLTIGILASPALPATLLFKKRLTNFLGEHYTIAVIDDSQGLPANFRTFDLLISPYSRPDLRHPNLISLNFFPSHYEWQTLTKLISQIKTRKNMTSAPFFDTMVGELLNGGDEE